MSRPLPRSAVIDPLRTAIVFACLVRAEIPAFHLWPCSPSRQSADPFDVRKRPPSPSQSLCSLRLTAEHSTPGVLIHLHVGDLQRRQARWRRRRWGRVATVIGRRSSPSPHPFRSVAFWGHAETHLEGLVPFRQRRHRTTATADRLCRLSDPKRQRPVRGRVVKYGRFRRPVRRRIVAPSPSQCSARSVHHAEHRTARRSHSPPRRRSPASAGRTAVVAAGGRSSP